MDRKTKEEVDVEQRGSTIKKNAENKKRRHGKGEKYWKFSKKPKELLKKTQTTPKPQQSRQAVSCKSKTKLLIVLTNKVQTKREKQVRKS